MVDETAPKRHLTTMGLNEWVSAASAWSMRIIPREPLSRVREPKQYAQWFQIVARSQRADEIIVIFNETVVTMIAASQRLPAILEDAQRYCVLITSNKKVNMTTKWIFDQPPKKLAIQAWMGSTNGECVVCLESCNDPAMCFQCGKGVCADCLKPIMEFAVPKCPCCRVNWAS